jgi:glycosyltransferase involved in cell wall biosynthesis
LFANELRRLPRHVVDLKRTLSRANFALVHLNDSPLVVAAAVAHRAGIPVVWHLRSALPNEGRDRRSALLRAAIGGLGAASIAINDNVAHGFDVGSVVIPNMVDLERFRPGDSTRAKQRLGLPTDRPVVTYVGFVYPSKGFREFIDAASLLREQGVEATFLIVGGAVRGEEFFTTFYGRSLEVLGLTRDFERDARADVAALGLDEDVRFLPFTQDPAGLYQASDVVVAPSRGPEIGRPVLEASACGRAIVASGSIDGAGVILPGETGYLVPRRSPDALAAALGLLVRDQGLRSRLGENARRHAEALFDPEANALRVMALYDRVLAEAA